jgi:hypothetical protein
MLRIIANPATLTTLQRKAIADFIVNFPAVEADGEVEDEPTIIPTFAVYEETDESPEVIFSPATNLVTLPAPPAHFHPTVPGIALDSKGLPWDVRIHTSSHATNADGSWRRKRGVDEATIAQVEGELQALMSIPFTPSAVLPFVAIPEVAQASAVPPPPPPPAAVVVAPAPPAPPAPPAAPEADPYIGLITRVSDLIVAKAISMDQVNAAVTAVGCASLGLLMSRPDLVPQVRAAIEGWVAAA